MLLQERLYCVAMTVIFWPCSMSADEILASVKHFCEKADDFMRPA